MKKAAPIITAIILGLANIAQHLHLQTEIKVSTERLNATITLGNYIANGH